MVAALLLPLAARAQSIALNVSDSARVFVAPNAKLTVPVSVDLTAAGALNLASLQAGLTWSTSRLTFDSIRVAPSTGFTLTPNPANAASGSLTFNAFSATALAASGPLFNLFFTAGATSGGTRVALAPIVAATDMAQDLLNQLAVRSVDVCVATHALWGDVNDDGLVNVIDAQQIARYSVGLAVGNPTVLAARGDVTADGAVNIIDAQQIARFSVALSAAARVNAPSLSVAPVAAVAVTPAGDSLVVGQTVGLSAALQDSTAASVAGCYAVTWTSSDTTVAKVSSAGLATAVAAGTATITATSGALSAHATVTAFALGDATQVGTTGGVVQAAGSGATINVPAGALSSGSLLVQLKDSIGYLGVDRPLADRAYLLSVTPIGNPTWGSGQSAVLTLPITQAPAAGQAAVVSVVVAGDTMWFPGTVTTAAASAARVAKSVARSATPTAGRSAAVSAAITPSFQLAVNLPAIGLGAMAGTTPVVAHWMSASNATCTTSQYPSAKGTLWTKDPSISDDLRHHPQQTPISGNVQVVLVEGINLNVGDCADFTTNGTRTEDYFAKLTPVLHGALGGAYPLWAFTYPTSNQISTSGRALAADLEALHSTYPSSDIVIVAHSMGGLVSRLAATQLTSATTGKLKGIITLGTPHLGAPLAELGNDLLADVWPLGLLGFKPSWGMHDLYVGLQSQLTEEVPLYAYAGDIFGRLAWTGATWRDKELSQLQVFACGSYPLSCLSDGIVPVASATPTFISRGKAYSPVSYDHFELYDGIGRTGSASDPLYLSIIADIKNAAPAPPVAQAHFASITTGADHSCALTALGVAYCWGANDEGQLGDGTTTSRVVPIRVTGNLVFGSLTAGYGETCGLTKDGTAYCWGNNVEGSLGTKNLNPLLAKPQPTPMPVLGNISFTSLSTFQQRTCGLAVGGAVYCWGPMSWDPNYVISFSDGPHQEAADHTFSEVSVGRQHTCALSTLGEAYCWGQNDYGQLGIGTAYSITGAFRPDTFPPVRVLTDQVFVSIRAGWDHSCGLTGSGLLYCWGTNNGAFGDGASDGSLVPVLAAGGQSLTTLASGGGGRDGNCALAAGGAAYCWGTWTISLGIGSVLPPILSPVPVAGGLRFATLTRALHHLYPDFEHRCALTADGSAYCWGANDSGQLGDGTMETRLVPTPVKSGGIP